MSDVERHLLFLLEAGRAAGEVPLLGSPGWCALRRDDPRAVASIARAALLWWRDGQPEAIRAQLLAELEHNDQLAAWRLRAMSGDLSHALADGGRRR